MTPSVCFAATSLLYRVPAKILRSKRFVGRGDAGVKSVAVAVRRSLAYAPCGDAVTHSVCFAATSLSEGGKGRTGTVLCTPLRRGGKGMGDGGRGKSSQRYACFVDKRHFRVYNEWHEARNVPRNLRQVSLPRRSVGVLLRDRKSTRLNSSHNA